MGFLSGVFGSGPQKEVARILKTLGGLTEESEAERKTLRKELASFEEVGLEPLVKWLERAPRLGAPYWMMLDVCESMARLGDDSLLSLAPFARQEPPERRAAALLALGMTGRREAVPVCVEAIATQEDLVVVAACTAIKAIGSADAVDDLARILGDTGVATKTRIAVASAIASLKSPKSAKAIVEAAKDPQLGSAIPGCFATMGPLVVPTIVEALGNPSPAVRKVMVESLAAVGAIGGDESVRGLSKALRDQDADVRSQAAHALQKMGRFGPLVAALKEEQFDNRFVIQALNAMGTKNRELIQAFANLLEAMGSKVTTGSMFAVEKLKDADMLPPALRYLEEVTQHLPDESDFMEPAIRLKREVRTALASRGRA